MLLKNSSISSGRFLVEYALTPAPGQTAESLADDICLEQSVEIPRDCIPPQLTAEGIAGQLETLIPDPQQLGKFTAIISFNATIALCSIAQFVNTLFGNISLKNNIRMMDVKISPESAGLFPGPAFGIEGIRKMLNVQNRPLTCAALKPVGLSSKELAQLAHDIALGGIDIIKEDHGISNQATAPFTDRVQAVQDAIARANARTGLTTLYCPMINDAPKVIDQQIDTCTSAGIRGVLAAPSLIGYSTFAEIARLKKFVVMAHPALTGTFFTTQHHGATPAFFLGTLFRILGGDVSIFPIAGGRFPFTQEECDNLCEALRTPESFFKPAFPSPAGGMNLERIPEMISRYGNDTVLMIGGNLLQHPEGLTRAAQVFTDVVKSKSSLCLKSF